MNIWDKTANAQLLLSNTGNKTGPINTSDGKVAFGATLDAVKALPKNPGSFNDSAEVVRKSLVDLAATNPEIAAGTIGFTLAGPVGAVGMAGLAFGVRQVDDLTNGGASKLLMAGAKEVRSNYAFQRDVAEKNAAIGFLTGLAVVSAGVLGGLAGFATAGPGGAYVGATLAAAAAGKLQRNVAESDALGKKLAASARLAKTDKGQEEYNLGRDVTRNVLAKVPGFRTLGDTSRGFGASVSGLINVGYEWGTAPDAPFLKGLGMAAKSKLGGPIVEPVGSFSSKINSEAAAERVTERLLNDAALIRRTMDGEETAYTPVFKFYRESTPAELLQREEFNSEAGQIGAHLLAGASDEQIGLVLLSGRGIEAATEILAAKHAARYAELARFEDAIATVNDNGHLFFDYQGKTLQLSKKFKNNVDFVKAEMENLRSEVRWLDDALNIEGSMTKRTVSRWAYVEKLRNDFAKEQSERRLATGAMTEMETAPGKAYQYIYQRSPFSKPIRFVDRITDDAPKPLINYNEPIMANTRVGTSLRSAEKFGASTGKENVRIFNDWMNARTEVQKDAVLESYVAQGMKLLANKYRIPDAMIDDVVQKHIETHRTVKGNAKVAKETQSGYMNDPYNPEQLLSDPQLITQLSNGFILPDWKFYDSVLKEYSKTKGAKLSFIQKNSEGAKLFADEVNSLWRSLTLLRSGYPINVIKDTHIRAWGDAALFGVWKNLGEDALEAAMNSSNTVWRIKQATKALVNPKQRVKYVREQIDIYEAHRQTFADSLKKLGYDVNNPTGVIKINMAEEVKKLNPAISTTDGVGLVKTSFVKKFMEFDRAGKDAYASGSSAKTIADITADLKAGKGFTNPVTLEYWVDKDGNLLLNLTEGNHRLQAALNAGIKDMPVRVVRSKGWGASTAKATGSRSKIQPDDTGYLPGNPAPQEILADAAFSANYLQKAPKVITDSTVLRHIDSYKDVENTLVTLRDTYATLTSGAPAKRISKDYIKIGDETFNSASGGRFGSLFMSKITQKDDLRRAMAGIRELEIEAARRGTKGTRSINPTEESLHLQSWEQILNDKIRFDDVARMILQGKSKKVILEWLRSEKGFSYMDRFAAARKNAPEVYERVKTMVDLYAPSAELKALVISDKLTVPELVKLYPDVNTRPVVFTDLVDDMLHQSTMSKNYRQLIKDAVAWLSTAPTSKLGFNPYYRVKYEEELQGQILIANAQGRKLTPDDKLRFEKLAHNYALKEYREKLNSFHRDMNYSGVMNYLLAFFPAVVEQFRAYARITLDHPDFIVKKLRIATLPEQLTDVKVDANGNEYIEVDLPFYGLKGRIPTSWFNVDNPTGGQMISVSPYGSVLVNEFAKRTQIENAFTDMVLPYGVQRNSLNALQPNTVRRMAQVFRVEFLGNAEQFNKDVNMFNNQARFDFVKYENREPGANDWADIQKESERKAFYVAVLRALSAATLPVQARIVTPISSYVDIYSQYQEKYGADGFEKFNEDYPEYYMLADSLTESTSGVRPDKTAVGLIKKNKDAILRVVSAVGNEEHLSVLGAIFNDDDYAFSSAAQAYLQDTKIPGSNKKFRDVSDAFANGRLSIVNKGWKDLNTLQETVKNYLLNSNPPIDPTRGVGASIVDSYKQDYIAQMKTQNPMWWDEWESMSFGGAGSRQASLVKALTTAIEDDNLWKDLSKQNKWHVITDYLQFRFKVNSMLEQRGTTIDSARAYDIREYVRSNVEQLKAQDTGFAKLYDRYFSEDKFDYVYEGV